MIVDGKMSENAEVEGFLEQDLALFTASIVSTPNSFLNEITKTVDGKFSRRQDGINGRYGQESGAGGRT